MFIYALIDDVIGQVVAETVMAQHNFETAKRYLRDVVRGDSPVARHPEDFSLVCLCELDLEKGSVSGSSVKHGRTKVSTILQSSSVPLQEVD